MTQTHDTAPAVLATGLVKTFGNLRAVDGIDLEVVRGEVFGVLGPNGAGKTTMLQMLATLLPISISAAGASGDTPVPVAVARISTLGYLGSFTAPALIGYLASSASLPTALLLPAIAVAVTALAAPVVRSPHRPAAPGVR